MENVIIIQNLIYEIRSQKVMLDSDLAKLYGVDTKRLNEAVKRNIERFPEDFMFQITSDEASVLRSQFATSKPEKGGRRYLPYVFTEHGVLMLSSVLKSHKASIVNIQIMRTFVKLRQIATRDVDITRRMNELEKYFIQYTKDNDEEINKINEALNYLTDITKPGKIGFN